jgi:hypothetical protein
MNKVQIFVARLMLLFMLSQLSSCQKFIDKLHPGHTQNDYTRCRIKHITTQVGLDTTEELIGTVEYNNANNPVGLTYNKHLAYLVYLRFMTYDSLNRLKTYKVFYDETTEVESHTYGYVGDRIMTDTSISRLTGYIKVLSTFEYDSKGRIAVENREVLDFEGPPDTWEHLEPLIYLYDSNDNLVDHDYTYDDKINFRRTNKVWMFIQRDYSKNNLQGATEYNEHGLPTRFNNSKDPLFYTGPLTSIDYECDL